MPIPFDPDIMARANPGLWLEAYGRIRNGKGALERPTMNILQRRINAVFLAARRKQKPCFVIGLKPRKRGFSTMVSAVHYTEMMNHCYKGVIIGNKLATSEEVLDMLKTFAANDGFRGRWGGDAKNEAKPTTEMLRWGHGSEVTLDTAKAGEDSIRGQTPQFVHGTEVAHWDGEEAYLLGLMNALPDSPGVSCFLESTPNGDGGGFASRWTYARWPAPDECPPGQADYWRKWEASCADNGNSMLEEQEFVRVFAAWFEFEDARLVLEERQRKHIEATVDAESWYAGERDLIAAYGETMSDGRMRLGTIVEGTDVWEQLAWRRMTIKNKCGRDPRKFDQEYPKDPASCFLASGKLVFDLEALEYYKQLALLPRQCGDISVMDGTHRAVWTARPERDAMFWRWEAPKLGCAYLIVVDTAEGSDQTSGDDPDRHSVLVLRRTYRDAAGVMHRAAVVARIAPPCRIPIAALAKVVDALSRYYGCCIVIPEMNSSGLAYITAAQILGTPLWKRQEWNKLSGKKEDKLGWRTTDNADYGGVRTVIISALQEGVIERDIDIMCPNVVFELSKFVDKGNGRMEAGSGAHDDDVMSLAIGRYNIDAATTYGELAIDRRVPSDLKAILDQRESSSGGAHAW